MKIDVPYTRRRIGGRERGSPEVTLRVRTRYGDYVACRFIVDTGADFTAIPVSLAEREGIPFSRSQHGVAGSLVGQVTKYHSEFPG
jgi:predicted aspartyl protease